MLEPFRERWRSALLFVGVFAYSFLLFRTARFHLDPIKASTEGSALIAFVCASIAFYLESSEHSTRWQLSETLNYVQNPHWITTCWAGFTAHMCPPTCPLQFVS